MLLIIRIATIVIYLVLQSTPTHVNEVAGYSVSVQEDITAVVVSSK